MARTRTRDHRARSLRRLVLGAAAALVMASPALASGCGGGFDPISQVDGLRVFAVVADKADPDDPMKRVGGSYALPGETVRLRMSYFDGFVNPEDPDAAPRDVQVVWIAGCFNPNGDRYIECYPQLAKVFEGIEDTPPNTIPPGIGIGDTFEITLPNDIVSSRPPPPPGTGPHYGIAYVFFAACAGQIRPVAADSFGRAGAFPLGCFDAGGNRLGPESFVPGYTQIYAFADGRENGNPEATAFTIDGEPVKEGPGGAVKVKRCEYDVERRDEPPSCGKEGPYDACQSYEIDIEVPADIADEDPDGTSPEGQQLREVVWVDYFAESGNFDSPIKLLSDAQTGVTSDRAVKWIAPPEPGLVQLWAVIHDARGGAEVLQRWVEVE